MNSDQELSTRTQGQRLQNAERLVLIGKLVDELSNGYMSTYKLAKKLKVDTSTIDTYRPLADKLIAENKIDRNVIRNLQIKRTYLLIERLIDDLTKTKDIRDKIAIHGAIYKHSSHLALISGLNIETHVNVDPTKLVIIRANKKKQADRIDEQLLDAGKELVESNGAEKKD